MPIYEYVCEACKGPFEKLILSKAEPVACPSCGSHRHTLQFSVVSTPGKNGVSDAGSAAGSCACTPTTCGCS